MPIRPGAGGRQSGWTRCGLCYDRSRMKVIVRLAAAAAVSAICGAAAGADLYVEGFDSAEAAKVVENHAGAAFVEYVDYSSMRVGSVVHSIPEAPRRVEVRVPSPGPGSWIPPPAERSGSPGTPFTRHRSGHAAGAPSCAKFMTASQDATALPHKELTCRTGKPGAAPGESLNNSPKNGQKMFKLGLPRPGYPR